MERDWMAFFSRSKIPSNCMCSMLTCNLNDFADTLKHMRHHMDFFFCVTPFIIFYMRQTTNAK